ncbi:hypothetical protein NBO_11g0018 [Nosema bombycis CQ1]|uniref:Uncharacterized protein n=1 Tax=Nosema bombycis (strain CQ1 / CVCC 102059) TaxID=578461 RepID=R0ML52_NOSB1|nr:hypothetical protein NBO_11g0018 [Nosema bombycis CQ1]|eukprot:EOB14945.1 hypothetical protein NBO_11g0018 [Nosema bombycis CQ1]
MLLSKNFTKLTTENIGNLFLFGFGSKFLSKIIKKKYSLYDLRSCIRTGGEFAKHSLIYSLNLLTLSKLGITPFLLPISSTFLTGFLLGLKNGMNYASRSAIINSSSFIMKALVFGN